MKERPIIFSAPMVRAILEGRKTQTRRVVKPNHIKFFEPSMDAALERSPNLATAFCPYGQPGDRLWVREAWRACRDLNQTKPREIVPGSSIEYEATARSYAEVGLVGKLRPSMFMPRWASRILLEITAVRVERLQDISETDAQAEGVANSLHLRGGRLARENFAHLWLTINGDGSWEANPFVWVVSFRRMSDAS